MSELHRIISANLAKVREQIAVAAERSGRHADEITLVGVSKYVDATTAAVLIECGCHDLGESRPQTLWSKVEAIRSSDIRWHMIGHMQRNKLRRTLPLVSMLHSCDSERLLTAANDCLSDANAPLSVLVEVNISGDAAKHGFAADDVAQVLDRFADFPNLHCCGLMAMARLQGGAESSRDDFQNLRALRDRLQTNCPDNVSLTQLSMGMSRDFEIAIEEGATIVRVGSALFEGIER